MARSQLGAFVDGVRQLLTTQLVVSLVAIALAGWTLAITNESLRERDRLRARVVQLEATLAENNVMTPPATEIVSAPAVTANVYPPSIEANNRAQSGRGFNPGQFLGDLFSPAPPIRTIVLHARGEADASRAEALAQTLAGDANVRVITNTIAPRDARAAGYVYFDGRQSTGAAAFVQRFHDLAREAEIVAWSAQLRGVALPAEGEYSADRIDIILPALPAAPPAATLGPPT